MEAIVILILIVILYILYGNWLTKGISRRAFQTKLAPEEVRRLFEERVARSGWKIVDDGNPMVAQSSLITGIRQQIGLDVAGSDKTTAVVVGPDRWVTKWGVPKKGHTIRIRLNSFVEAVRERDGSIDVALMAND